MGSKLIEDIVVLYVEDDEEIRSIYERFLRRRVQHVIIASNGQEGYESYQKHKPDLIITDINMPIMNGLEMCSLIRDENVDLPIIVTSAHGEAQFFQEAINIGINMFLLKPVDMTQLYNTIKIASENIHLKAASIEDKQLVSKKTLELEISNEELRATIENLKQTQKKLVDTEHMASLGMLAAGIAHEINTPIGVGLTGITHFDEITKEINEKYQKDDVSEKEFEEYLETATELSSMIIANMTRTTHILKSFKQVAVDQSSEIKRKFKVAEYIDEILLSINNVIKKTNISFEINVNENLTIDSYPGAFSQIITNLILNAIKHGYDDAEEGTISIGANVEDNILRVIFKDDGKGITKENLPKVFDLFFTTQRNNGGTGLGLNIVYNIITSNLKGSIKCESIEKEGTVFDISIPLDDK